MNNFSWTNVFFYFALIMLGVFIGHVAALSFPSTLIVHQPVPEVLDLQQVDPMSAIDIAGLNDALKPWRPMSMPLYGHYTSELTENVSSEGLPLYMLVFANSATLLPTSVKETKNVTK